MKLALLECFLAAGEAGAAAALATDLASGVQLMVTAAAAEGELVVTPAALAAIRAAIAEDRSGVIDTDSGSLFVDVSSPPPRLLVVGAVHIAQALTSLARQVGFAVTVVDPRAAFASAVRFPDVTLVADWPDEVLPALAPDRRTAVVVLTHDAKIDDPALLAALRTEAFYVGALGSRRSHADRIQRLAAAGVDAAALARIRGPVGLAIGARSPTEMAISILAEIIAVRYGTPLADRPGWYERRGRNDG